MTEVSFAWIGSDHRGHARTGFATADPGEFVRARFHQRWQALRLRAEGRVIGAIEVVDGARRWWVE